MYHTKVVVVKNEHSMVILKLS